MHRKRQLEQQDSSLLSCGTTQTNFPSPRATGQRSVLFTGQDNRVKRMFGLLSPFLGIQIPFASSPPAASCLLQAGKQGAKHGSTVGKFTHPSGHWGFCGCGCWLFFPLTQQHTQG